MKIKQKQFNGILMVCSFMINEQDVEMKCTGSSGSQSSYVILINDLKSEIK